MERMENLTLQQLLEEIQRRQPRQAPAVDVRNSVAAIMDTGRSQLLLEPPAAIIRTVTPHATVPVTPPSSQEIESEIRTQFRPVIPIGQLSRRPPRNRSSHTQLLSLPVPRSSSGGKVMKLKVKQPKKKTVFLLNEGMDSIPTKKDDLIRNGRVMKCVEISHQFTEDELRAMLEGLFPEKLALCRNPKFHYVDVDKTRVNRKPPVPPGTLMTGDNVLQLAGQGQLYIMANGTIPDNFDAMPYCRSFSYASPDNSGDELPVFGAQGIGTYPTPEIIPVPRELLLQRSNRTRIPSATVSVPPPQVIAVSRELPNATISDGVLASTSATTRTPSTTVGTSLFEVDYENEEYEELSDRELEPVAKKARRLGANEQEDGESGDPCVLLNEHLITRSAVFTKVLYIRRSTPFRSFISEIKNVALVDNDHIEVKFKDSLKTVDDRGVRRDFFQRLLNDVVHRSGVLQPVGGNSYTLTHSAEKLENNWYYAVGRALATTLVFGGPAPKFLSGSIYDALTKPYDEVQPEIAETPEEFHDLLWKLLEFEEDQPLQTYIMAEERIQDVFTSAGITKWLITCQEVPQIVRRVVKFLVLGKCRSELEDVKEGLFHYGILPLMKRHPSSMKRLFVRDKNPKPLGVSDIVEGFPPMHSPEQSNKKEAEENIHDLWIEFLRNVETGKHSESGMSLEKIFLFITGVKEVPPTGWGTGSMPSVIFDHAPKSDLLQARCCNPSVILPIWAYSDIEHFEKQALYSINNSPSILLE